MCRRCGKIFTTGSGLSRHSKAKHNDFDRSARIKSPRKKTGYEIWLDDDAQMREVWHPSTNEIEAEVLSIVSASD